MSQSDERILQRFRSGASTFQIASDKQLGMTEPEVEAALHRAQDLEYSNALSGGYLGDLMDARYLRRAGTDDSQPPRYVYPNFRAVARSPSER